MSKLKAIGKAAQEAAEKLATPVKAANDVAKVQGKLPPVRQNSIDELFQEYAEAKAKMRQGDGSALSEWNQKYHQSVDTSMKQEREKALFDPTVEARQAYINQTQTPEEFARRYKEQFSDRDFSYRTAYSNDPDDIAYQHLNFGPDASTIKKHMAERALEDLSFQFTIAQKAFSPIKRPRSRQKALAWLGESPYRRGEEIETPYIFVHMDRWSDPTRPLQSSGDPIQFTTAANELGMHSGTYKAAEQAAVRDINEVQYRQTDFQDELDQLAGLSDNPDGFKQMVSEAIEAILVDRFKSNGWQGWSEIGKEVGEEARRILLEANVPTPSVEAAKFLRNIRALPVPSTIPHLFRGKNGLYLKDLGGFGNETVGKQLKELFPEDMEHIDAILSGQDATKGIRKFIEDKGFDHVVYHNSAEDKGSISIINWNPDLWMPLYDPRIHSSADDQAAAMASVVMGALGFGYAAVQSNKQGET